MSESAKTVNATFDEEAACSYKSRLKDSNPAIKTIFGEEGGGFPEGCGSLTGFLSFLEVGNSVAVELEEDLDCSSLNSKVDPSLLVVSVVEARRDCDSQVGRETLVTEKPEPYGRIDRIRNPNASNVSILQDVLQDDAIVNNDGDMVPVFISRGIEGSFVDGNLDIQALLLLICWVVCSHLKTYYAIDS